MNQIRTAGRVFELTKIVPAAYVDDDEFLDYFRDNMRQEIVRSIQAHFKQHFPRAMENIRRWHEHERPWPDFPPTAPGLEIRVRVIVESFDV